jgi:hypothetical protein
MMEKALIDFPALSARELADILGWDNDDIDIQIWLDSNETAGVIFSLQYYQGTKLYPIFQFDLTTKKPFPMLEEILYNLRDKDDNTKMDDGIRLYLWFIKPLTIENKSTNVASLVSDETCREDLLYLSEQTGAARVGRIFD